MKKKVVTRIMLTLLLIGMLTLAFNIQRIKSDWTWAETIRIKADGSVAPDTAPISTVDNITYTLTDNIVGDVPEGSDAIVVERDNIVVDGAGYTLQGTGNGTGIDLSGRSNVTIKNMRIQAFSYGIYLYDSSNNSIFGNNITNNGYGIYLGNADDSEIHGNTITNNTLPGVGGYGIGLWNDCDGNRISGNTISDNGYGIGVGSGSDGNTISGNTVSHNSWGWGINLYQSSNNTVYHNNIIDNTIQANDDNPSMNDWHHPTLLEGNYWSDYAGVDDGSGVGKHAIAGDGIGDTLIPHPDTDYDFYPLTNPWTPSQPTSVGGIYIPVNKLELLASYIGLTILSAVAVVTVAYVKKRKRDTEINS